MDIVFDCIITIILTAAERIRMQHAVQNAPSLPSTITVTLKGKNLWQEFHNHNTEMVITKQGR